MRSKGSDQAAGDHPLRLSRRQLLKLGAVGSAGLLLPMSVRPRLAYAASPAVTKFSDPLPRPRVFNTRRSGVYTARMRQIQHELHSEIGPTTTVWGFGDRDGYSFPGPTFETRTGQPITVRWINALGQNAAEPHYLDIHPSVLAAVHGAEDNRKAVVHLHGGHVRADADGYPYDTILPGESAVYRYDLDQQAATLWYHDHALGNTRLNVYMGLAGFFLVRDATEAYFIRNQMLPEPTYEFPIVFQDRRLGGDGTLKYDARFDDSFVGDVAVVNGRVFPYLDVEPRKYRFRLLNGSNARTYTFRLGDGSPVFQQIGTDGGFLPAPLTLNEITLTPGERADVIVDFAQPGLSSGDDLILYNTFNMDAEFVLPELVKFRIQFGGGGDPVSLPASLTTIDPIPAEAATTERSLELEDFPDPALGESIWKIDSLGFDDITEVVQNNSVEIWNFVNKSSMIHPMHLHLVQFQVLSRTDEEGNDLGVDANERGWKDTVRVGPKETVQIISRFVGRRNDVDSERFPYHCHILEHEDHEMMRQFQLEYV